MACVQAQAYVSIGLLRINAPLLKKSAAEMTSPAASRGSLVFATNRNRNSIRPSYQFKDTNLFQLSIILRLHTHLLGNPSADNPQFICCCLPRSALWFNPPYPPNHLILRNVALTICL